MKALELADKKGKWTSSDCMDAAAELRRLAAVESDCAQYLKEGETPAERIKRALGDADSLMNLYRDVVAERDALKAENALLEEVNAQLREQDMTDSIKLPLVATSDHPEFPVLVWSPLELAEINRLMREAVRLNAQAVPCCTNYATGTTCFSDEVIAKPKI